MKHTPGPWTVRDGFDKEGNGKYFPSVILNDTKEWKSSNHPAKIVVNESHDSESESIMANAYLVAAAPDLLEAINQMMISLNHSSCGWNMDSEIERAYQLCKNAIKKAQL